jgi:hypothetical protein
VREAPVTDSQWHLDRKVPIAFIFVLLGQILGFGWVSAKMDSRIESLEMADRRHERAIELLISERDGIRDRLKGLEEVQKATNDLLRRIDERLERLARP